MGWNKFEYNNKEWLWRISFPLIWNSTCRYDEGRDIHLACARAFFWAKEGRNRACTIL